MSDFTKKLSAGFLTVAILGSTGAYLAGSLASPVQKYSVESAQTQTVKTAQQQIEVVTVTARRAS